MDLDLDCIGSHMSSQSDSNLGRILDTKVLNVLQNYLILPAHAIKLAKLSEEK